MCVCACTERESHISCMYRHTSLSEILLIKSNYAYRQKRLYLRSVRICVYADVFIRADMQNIFDREEESFAIVTTTEKLIFSHTLYSFWVHRDTHIPTGTHIIGWFGGVSKHTVYLCL